uniref:Uncharacterized protein n=1 Tax=Salix viminalis TaxID=40686 RepID=A0A6N2LMA8_SALVM
MEIDVLELVEIKGSNADQPLTDLANNLAGFIGEWKSEIPGSEHFIIDMQSTIPFLPRFLSGANLGLLLCCCNDLLMLAGGDFDDADDVSLFPSCITLFFIDSTSGLLPSPGAVNEKLSFCPNDSAHSASNELNMDVIMIETQIEEAGSACVFSEISRKKAASSSSSSSSSLSVVSCLDWIGIGEIYLHGPIVVGHLYDDLRGGLRLRLFGRVEVVTQVVTSQLVEGTDQQMRPAAEIDRHRARRAETETEEGLDLSLWGG